MTLFEYACCTSKSALYVYGDCIFFWGESLNNQIINYDVYKKIKDLVSQHNVDILQNPTKKRKQDLNWVVSFSTGGADLAMTYA